MMLVRTDDGFKAAAIDPRTQYVWDQPLHPEREQHVAAAAARQAVLQQPPQKPSEANGRNGNGHAANGLPARAAASPVTAPPLAPPVPEGPVFERRAPLDAPVAPAPAPVAPAPALEPHSPQAPIATAPDVEASGMDVAGAPDQPAGREGVALSKKAIAVAIALVVGLPLGSKVLNLSGSRSQATRAPAVTAPGAPAPLVTPRSGFISIAGDAARYAVLIRNPNKGAAAHGVAVNVALFDADGRLIGTDSDRVSVIPPGGTTAVAGTTDTDGTPARLEVRLTADGFLSGTPSRLFTVRGVKLSRSGAILVVRAAVSAARATRGARIVAVHYDARGAILGGDLTYVDIPRGHAVAAVVRTSVAAARVHHVDVFVLAPR
jgi:hypothetical protein